MGPNSYYTFISVVEGGGGLQDVTLIKKIIQDDFKYA